MQTVNSAPHAASYTSKVDDSATGSCGQDVSEERSGTVRIDNIPRSIQVKHQQHSLGVVDKVTFNKQCADRSTTIPGDPYFPRNHTFQPYFWISTFANEKLYADKFQPEANVLRVVDQLSMSKKEARQYFAEHFEYRQVDYGYNCTCEHPEEPDPGKNYGLFARAPVRCGDVLGVYSGVAYLLRNSAWLKQPGDLCPKTLQPAFYREMPDFMSCHRNLQASVRGKTYTQRTASKFSMEGNCADAIYTIYIAPDNNRLTPMHFVNSANCRPDVNAVVAFVPVATAMGQFTVPAYVAVRDIQVGEEILSDYLTSEDKKTFRVMPASQEKLVHDGNIQKQMRLAQRLNCAEMVRPISPFVAAPVIYVSETVRKCHRQKHDPVNVDVTRDGGSVCGNLALF